MLWLKRNQNTVNSIKVLLVFFSYFHTEYFSPGTTTCEQIAHTPRGAPAKSQSQSRSQRRSSLSATFTDSSFSPGSVAAIRTFYRCTAVPPLDCATCAALATATTVGQTTIYSVNWQQSCVWPRRVAAVEAF